jgi:uncharacterized NAD(P)/FAD-binding protein YdhS
MWTDGRPDSDATIAVIGGGFSGSLFALKLAHAQPHRRIFLIERERRLGRGLAYGACAPHHLLNVPVHRMEPGLTPRFEEWLQHRREGLGDALEEAGGILGEAYVQRAFFGDYLEEQVTAALSRDRASGIVSIRGDAVGISDSPNHDILLSDGRRIPADIVVLATGNLAPRAPGFSGDWVCDSHHFIPDPWAPSAFEDLAPDAPVLMLGTGLTMVDIALKLTADGHRGPMHALSRRGLLPLAHRGGGTRDPFLHNVVGASPLTVARMLRKEALRAKIGGVPWQRVVDAARPMLASVWQAWSETQRKQFLRHQRPRWDVHRYRTAPRIAKHLHALIDSRRLDVHAGRIAEIHSVGGMLNATVALRGGKGHAIMAASRIVNCTGPRSDLARIALPLLADLKRRGLLVPDRLGLGLEAGECAVISAAGRPSNWLFALGPLTRPALWEVTAVPEITVQIDQLVQDFIAPERQIPATTRLADAFIDLGAGI